MTSPRLTSAWTIFLFGLSVALSSACRSTPPSPAPEAPLEAPFAGCAAIVVLGDTTVCELGASRVLRFVLPEGVVADGGRMERGRLVVDVPAGADAITVRAHRDRARLALVLRVRNERRAPWIDEAKALRAAGKANEAGDLARPRRESADPAERAAANGLMARLALAEGRADEAFPLFRDAIRDGRACGRLSDAVDDSFALAFALHQRSHRYAEARAVLDGLSGDLPRYPEGRAREPYYRGILASETGDRRAASTLLREAEARASALGMSKLVRNAKAALALEMQALGDARSSLSILRALEAEAETSACERAELANDLGWGALLLNAAAEAEIEPARAPLERVLSSGCQDAYVLSFAHTNLARLALDADAPDPETAKRHLAQAKARVAEPRGTEHLAWLDIEARIALREGRFADALARFDDERELARASVLLDPEWSADVGRAAALDGLRRRSEALSALRAAEAIVDRAVSLVPLGAGRGGFVADRSASARSLVDRLAEDDPREAATIAKHAQRRAIASVERGLRIERLSAPDRARWEEKVRAYRAARDALDAEAASDWKLSKEKLASALAARRAKEDTLRQALDEALALVRQGESALPRPRDGDLELVLGRGQRGVWHGFAVDARAATRLPLAAPKLDPMLASISARIDGAKRVRVYASGPWRDIDVHAQGDGSGPLVSRIAVDYPLGFDAVVSAEARGGALVVGDPRGDLPRAAEEAAHVRGSLDGVLLLRDAATSRAISQALPDAKLFHYAGHGSFGGQEGLASELPLAQGGRLSASDILALPRVPNLVVLSGCEAAKADALGGLGLAQAFAVAGADEVIAPVRPVSDVLAASLAEALYAEPIDVATPGALARALRRASMKLRERDPKSDWAAFRVIAR